MTPHHLISSVSKVGLLLAAVWLAGCESGDRIQESRQTETVQSPEADPASSWPDPNVPIDPNGPIMAVVNGEPIPMARLHRILVRTEGLPLAMQLVVNELVRQEAGKHGITVSEKEIRREADQTISRGFGGRDLTADQREALLKQYLKQAGISRTQWDLTMIRNAMLGKLLARTVSVSQKQLKDEFNRRFGRRVVVRHIEVASLADAQSVLKQLKAGKDFASVARRESINPSAKDGGLLPPISARTIGVPPAMRSVAVSMDKVGEISDPIQIETTFHILRLEKIIPPQDVSFEEKKDQLQQIVRSRVVNQRKQAYLMQMYSKAMQDGRIRFVDPILQDQFRKRRQEKPTP